MDVAFAHCIVKASLYANISLFCICYLKIFKKNPTDFMRHFVTIDETWRIHYTPESKMQFIEVVNYFEYLEEIHF